MQKTDFMNAVSRFEYGVNMMCRKQILLMQKQILSMQKNIFDYCEIQNAEKAFKFGVEIQKTRFDQLFYEKTMNIFLNSEQKIIYAEKRVNNFLNNAEQKLILCKIVEIDYAENGEKFL